MSFNIKETVRLLEHINLKHKNNFIRNIEDLLLCNTSFKKPLSSTEISNIRRKLNEEIKFQNHSNQNHLIHICRNNLFN